MSIHLIAGLGAALVVARFTDGQVVILADPAEGWRRLLAISRPLMYHHERRELLRALVA